MTEIKCPKDIGFENIFNEEDCNTSDACYHCWTSSIAKHDQDLKKNMIKCILDTMAEEPKQKILKELSTSN